MTKTCRAARALEDGVIIRETDLAIETTYTVSCECGKPEHVVTWVQEKVSQDADALPDEFYKIITLERQVPADQADKDPGKYAFIGKRCLLKWLRTHSTYPSPRKRYENNLTVFPGPVPVRIPEGEEQ